MLISARNNNKKKEQYVRALDVVENNNKIWNEIFVPKGNTTCC